LEQRSELKFKITLKSKTMKKFLTIMLVLTGLFLASCEKEGAKLLNFTVKVSYPAGYSFTDMSDIKVTVVNNLTSREDSARTDADGYATLQIEAGSYTISASMLTEEFAFNGIVESVTVNDVIISVDVSLVAVSLEGGLVFKEIYYTGSKTPSLTSYYADQFHEIYNNSDEVIYLDGLCISVLDPTSSTTASPWVKSDGSLRDSLPCLFHVWMWPGTGQQYPLAPRTSIVLAQDGINHQTDPAGNPSSPVNLANAQWETYVQASGKDTDTPGVPNLTLVYTTSTTMFDWLSSVFGSAVVLFRLPTGLDYQSFVSNPANFKTKPGSSSTTQYLMVDKNWVIDGVDEVQADPTKQFKRLPVALDAGKVNCSGTYVSKSVRRKVDKIIGGKVIYKDTNNSTNDFLGEQTPTPFIHPAVVDAK
jgi:hypothetical protein